METQDIANAEEKVRKALQEINELVISLLTIGQSKHGELTIAKALQAGNPPTSIMTSDTKDPKQVQYLTEMVSKLQDKDNGIGQICFMKVDLSDGTEGLIIQTKDVDKVRSLAKNIEMNLNIANIDVEHSEGTWHGTIRTEKRDPGKER